MISIAHLEPAPLGRDSFDRTLEPPLLDTRDDAEAPENEIETILDKRQSRVGRNKPFWQYLISWKGFGPEHTGWVHEDYLDNAAELIREFNDNRRNNIMGNNTENDPELQEPIKRGRRRPRKVLKTQETATSLPAIAKQGRGRPRKT